MSTDLQFTRGNEPRKPYLQRAAEKEAATLDGVIESVCMTMCGHDEMSAEQVHFLRQVLQAKLRPLVLGGSP